MTVSRQHVPLVLVPKTGSRETSDADLARALISGAAWAHAETWNRYAPMVFKMAVRTLGSTIEAEDVVQEVFYRVLGKAKTLQNPESLRSFIVSFAIRILKWELRRKRTREWLSLREPEALAESAIDHFDVESRDLLRRFYALLARLAPRERLVFSLRHIEAMTLEEIAEAMELSLSTVKRSQEKASSRLSRWVEVDLGLAGWMEGRRGGHGS